MDTTTLTTDAIAGAGRVKRFGQAIWKGVRAFGVASPRIVAVLLLASAVTIPALIYFGFVRMPSPDATLQTQLDGAGLSINRIEADIKTLAAKGDVAALAARIDKLERAASPAALTTGSITTKPRR